MSHRKLQPDAIPMGETLSPEFLLGFRRALYRGVGFSRADVRRPLVGVVSSWGEINPASRELRGITQEVKRGVSAAGGTPAEVVLSGLCDGTCAAAHSASRYNLPWRDAAVAYLECVAHANMFDALVLVGVCDEVVPAHLIAAARLDIPALLVVGGSMTSGSPGYPHSIQGTVWAGTMTAAYDDLLSGNIQEDEYLACEDGCCRGAGACGVMGTANTMQVFAEACGLTLPGNAVVPGENPTLRGIAYSAGRQVMELLRLDLRPSRILTPGALQNAIRTILAVGGSTCAVLHVLALAKEAGLTLTLEDFDSLGRSTPLLVGAEPAGRHSVADFHRAGGVQATLMSLEPLLDLDALTVTGQDLRHQLESVVTLDQEVIRPLSAPLQPEGAIAVLKGSLAPRGAVFKQSASEARYFRGPARVFRTEEEAARAILAGTIRGGEVLVVRDCGPKGAPGMPCLYASLWLLRSRGLDDGVAVVTDGRLSGTIRGLAVGHVSPESAENGPLAAVQDGDVIEMDVKARRIDLLLGPDEVTRRLSLLSTKPAPELRGFLAQYRSLVGPADTGAVLATSVGSDLDIRCRPPD